MKDNVSTPVNISKSAKIPIGRRNTIFIDSDLYWLLVKAATEYRVKRKDLITHLLVNGLDSIGYDTVKVRQYLYNVE